MKTLSALIPILLTAGSIQANIIITGGFARSELRGNTRSDAVEFQPDLSSEESDMLQTDYSDAYVRMASTRTEDAYLFQLDWNYDRGFFDSHGYLSNTGRIDFEVDEETDFHVSGFSELVGWDILTIEYTLTRYGEMTPFERAYSHSSGYENPSLVLPEYSSEVLRANTRYSLRYTTKMESEFFRIQNPSGHGNISLSLSQAPDTLPSIPEPGTLFLTFMGFCGLLIAAQVRGNIRNVPGRREAQPARKLCRKTKSCLAN